MKAASAVILVLFLLVWSKASADSPSAQQQGSSTPTTKNRLARTKVNKQEYEAMVSSVEERRKALLGEYRRGDREGKKRVLETARTYLNRLIAERLVPAWYGIPWKIVGKQREGESDASYRMRAQEIKACLKRDKPYLEGACTNCGLFVSTILKHAAFRVSRYHLGQQLAIHIIRTMSPQRQIKRPTGGQEITEFVAALKSGRRGRGIYIVGLDRHVGFLVYGSTISPEGKRQQVDVYFCHADYGHIPREVRCEEAARSPVLRGSESRVNGQVLYDAAIIKWLAGKKFVTVTE